MVEKANSTAAMDSGMGDQERVLANALVVNSIPLIPSEATAGS